MTRRPSELPPGLTKAPFTVDQGRSLGVSDRRLRADDLARPFFGVRQLATPADAVEDRGSPDVFQIATADLLARCAAAELVVPRESFFTHITAARLWPLPVPGLPNTGPLHIGVRPPEHPPRRAGVIGHHITDPRVYTVVRRGRASIDPATLFCQLSSVLRVEDLVAVGDALVLDPRFPDTTDERPWVSMRELGERIELFRGRGKTRAARAFALVRPGAESRMESLARLAIRAAGLPEPELNVEVYTEEGVFVGRGDMLYRLFRVVVEYDGEQHRLDTVQYDKDVSRLDDFAANGWRVVRITGRAFFGDRAGCLARIEKALVDGGWRR